MNRKLIIQEYWHLEEQLESIAKDQSISKRQLIKSLNSQTYEIISKTREILKRQVALLHHMRSWELEQAGNISLLPVSSLRSGL
jgi:hypothetical protein